MFHISLNQSGKATAALENVIPIHSALIRRLRKMRLNKSLQSDPCNALSDKSQVWPLIKNEERLTRQRSLEKLALSYWLNNCDITHQAIASYEETIEMKKREEVVRLSEIDNNTEKIALLPLLQKIERL